MTDIYPLVMEPFFRSGESTPWGGYALRGKYGKNTPDEMTGESLEISALPGRESRVLNGEYRGKNLQEMVALWGDRLTGKKEKGFPLVLKLLDARQCLSVQVHPDDLYAMLHEGKTGKSEAWYILDAEPGARIVYGVDLNGGTLRSVVESGRLEEHLHWVEVSPGDVFYLPSGTIHALGGGIQCYEIQESSDVTYRLWDWNRVGKNGRKRELHVRQALEVARTDSVPKETVWQDISQSGAVVRLRVDDPRFRFYTVDLNGRFSLPAGKMVFVTPAAACTIYWDGGSFPLAPWQSAVIPAGMCPAEIAGSCRVLVSCT